MSESNIVVSNRRLLKLAGFLRNVPRRQFNYSTWIGDDWKGKQDLSCGTTACALGWAATMPTFRRLGLHVQVTHTFDDGTTIGRIAQKGHSWDSPFDIAARIFRVTNEEASHLFAPNGSTEHKMTPKQVAKKIEKFVKNRTE